MLLTRRQMVEGGLAAGLLGLAAKPAFAADEVHASALRRRPGHPLVVLDANGAAPRIPHPGQPLPARAQPIQPALAEVRPAPATIPARPRVAIGGSVNPRLVAAARASFDRHRNSIRHTDIVGIADFTKVSSEPRFYLLDTNSGRVSEHHVSHGRGSDPGHTGFVQQFSNRFGSLATSEGGYVTSEYYWGKYGSSMRVRGLDWTNSNAEARAIVIHPAWYAEPSHLAMHGVLGRSEGCFAMSRASLGETLGRLGPGHFLYAARLA